MPTLIRTLSAHDAEIMARHDVKRLAVGGRVEVFGLQWYSDALLAWELSRRSLHQKPTVTVAINELDLYRVYVTPEGQEGKHIQADSTKPLYTQYLSLFEHKKIKANILRKAEISDLERANDVELYRARLEYRALLNSASDPVAMRRLKMLEDQMASQALAKAGGYATAQLDVSTLPSVRGDIPKKKRGRPKKDIASSGAAMFATQVGPEADRTPHPSDSSNTPTAAPAVPASIPKTLEERRILAEQSKTTIYRSTSK